MLTATGRATHRRATIQAPALRGRAGSQCRRYAKFGALTNQPLSRPPAVQCTVMVRATGSLHPICACGSANFAHAESRFTVPLDLGATSCLRID